MEKFYSKVFLTAALLGTALSVSANEPTSDAKTPAAVLTFAPGTEAVRIGTGGDSGYEFSIDWGDGVEETYNEQAYYTHLLAGDTVKIYGDGIVLVYANMQGVVSADISNAPNMIQVQFIGNDMETLTLGDNPSLTGLYAYENKLSSIDLSKCPALRVIDLHVNAIEGDIDCSAMSALSKIDIADNQISSLTLPKHSTVYEVDCSNNLLTQLDVTGLDGLSSLSCGGNLLTELDLTGLDAVEEVYAGTNKLTTIDATPCSNLSTLMVAENELTSLTIDSNTSLQGLYLQDNKLSTLDITPNTNIRWLNIQNNEVSELDVTNQPNLSILIASGNELSSIDLSNNTRLSSLDLADNALTTLDVTAIPYLSQFHFEGNRISDIDLSKNLYLYGLFCGRNELTALDLTTNTYLQRLEAEENKLTQLNLTANQGLQEVLIQGNDMAVEAIDEVIAALPDVNEVQPSESSIEFIRKFNISDMPGTAQANVAAAEQKGWFVTADTPASVTDIAGDSTATVVSTIYYNAAGISSAEPFDGFNIRVDTLSDGSRRSTKTSIRR